MPRAIEAVIKSVIVVILCGISSRIVHWLSIEQRVIPIIFLGFIIFVTLTLFDKKVKPKFIAVIHTKKP